MLILVLIDAENELNYFECDTAAEAVKIAKTYQAKGWKIDSHFKGE